MRTRFDDSIPPYSPGRFPVSAPAIITTRKRMEISGALRYNIAQQAACEGLLLMKLFVLWLVVMWGSGAAAAPLELLANLNPDLLRCDHARVFRDSRTHALTITFEYFAGEPEVRFPTKALGWPADWQQYRSLQYTFLSTSQEALSIAFSNGAVTKAFLTEPLPGIRIYGVIPFEVFAQTRTMTPLSPLGYKVWPNRLFTFENVQEIVFRMRYPNGPAQLTLYNLTLRPDVPEDDIIDRKPLIDRYGQWISGNWPGKAHSDPELRALWHADRIADASFPFCPLGGDNTRQLRSTGFFHTEFWDRRWTLVDPHGHPFFSAGMDLVGYRQGSFATDVRRRAYLFEHLPPPGPAWLKPASDVSFYVANIMKRFGENWAANWVANTIVRLKSWGFNTIGNWSDYDVTTRSGMPYVMPISAGPRTRRFPSLGTFRTFSPGSLRKTWKARRRGNVIRCATIRI
jgi:hypothetical protein